MLSSALISRLTNIPTRELARRRVKRKQAVVRKVWVRSPVAGSFAMTFYVANEWQEYMHLVSND